MPGAINFPEEDSQSGQQGTYICINICPWSLRTESNEAHLTMREPHICISWAGHRDSSVWIPRAEELRKGISSECKLTNWDLGSSDWGTNHTGQILWQVSDLAPRGVMDAVGSGAPPSARTPLSPLAFPSCGGWDLLTLSVGGAGRRRGYSNGGGRK